MRALIQLNPILSYVSRIVKGQTKHFLLFFWKLSFSNTRQCRMGFVMVLVRIIYDFREYFFGRDFLNVESKYHDIIMGMTKEKKCLSQYFDYL